MNVLRVKAGVEFTRIAPGGFRILEALNKVAGQLNCDITITSACDGQHSGPDDPHHRGEAFDNRTHDLPDKNAVLKAIQTELGDEHFFSWIEDEDQENEHIHTQVKKGTTYP